MEPRTLIGLIVCLCAVSLVQSQVFRNRGNGFGSQRGFNRGNRQQLARNNRLNAGQRGGLVSQYIIHYQFCIVYVCDIFSDTCLNPSISQIKATLLSQLSTGFSIFLCWRIYVTSSYIQSVITLNIIAGITSRKQSAGTERPQPAGQTW